MLAELIDARVMVLVAHYDDEALFCGGLLASQRPVFDDLTIVVATSIESTSAPRTPVLNPPEGELERRRLRLAAFAKVCSTLGARPVHFMAPNLSQSVSPEDDEFCSLVNVLQAQLVESMGAHPCDVLLTHGHSGEYGHPQHMAVHRAALGWRAESAEHNQPIYTFGTPGSHAYRYSHDGTLKALLLSLYRDQGPARHPWDPGSDPRMKAWTGRLEWYSRPTREAM